jgi:hypothetical protein
VVTIVCLPGKIPSIGKSIGQQVPLLPVQFVKVPNSKFALGHWASESNPHRMSIIKIIIFLNF